MPYQIKIPPKPYGSNIIGFKFNKKRIDAFSGEITEEIYDDDVANECKLTFPWVELISVDYKKLLPEERQIEEKKEEIKKVEGTPLKGFPGLGDITIERLSKVEITTREQLCEFIEKDPELVKKIVSPLVFSKIAVPVE